MMQYAVGDVMTTDVAMIHDSFGYDDEEIRRRIVDKILVRILWLDPSRVGVSVDQGVVTLDGTVELRSSMSIIRDLVARLPGVVRVTGNLTYRVDDVRYPYNLGSCAA